VSKQNSKAEINGRKMEKYKWELMKTLIMKTTNRKVIRKGTNNLLFILWFRDYDSFYRIELSLFNWAFTKREQWKKVRVNSPSVSVALREFKRKLYTFNRFSERNECDGTSLRQSGGSGDSSWVNRAHTVSECRRLFFQKVEHAPVMYRLSRKALFRFTRLR